MRISDWSSDVCSADRADGVGSGNLRPMPGLLFLPRRVFASRDQLPRLIATPARLNQADFGIGADAQLLLPAIDTVFQPPEFAAGRLDKQEQPERVTQLVGLGPGLRIPDCGIGERHNGGHFPRAFRTGPHSGPQIGRLHANTRERWWLDMPQDIAIFRGL